jgi:hypothetical protein
MKSLIIWGINMTGESKISKNTEDSFRYRLGKWLLNRNECVFTNVIDQKRDLSVHQYLLESINNWVDKKEEFPIQEFVSEMCGFIKGENEELYLRFTEKCALKGISVDEGIFEALSGMCACEDVVNGKQFGKPDDYTIV